MEQHLPADLQLVGKPRSRLGRILAPYLLVLPGGAWLLLFFLVPMVFLLSISLQTGNIIDGFRLTWRFANYVDAVRRYHTQFARSLLYGGLATAVALVASYPALAIHPAGQAFVDFLLSAQGQEILARYGFLPPQ